MSAWTWFWAIYAAVGIAAELIALTNARSLDTASETVWHWLTKPFSSKPANALTWLNRVVIGAFFCWLAIHFSTGLLST